MAFPHRPTLPPRRGPDGGGGMGVAVSVERGHRCSAKSGQRSPAMHQPHRPTLPPRRGPDGGGGAWIDDQRRTYRIGSPPVQTL